jgi:hypothetical protein
MSTFDPLQTLAPALHRGMARSFGAAVLAAALAGGSSGCAPRAGKPLVDGCYYAGGVPVLRVQGHTGTLLVPGNIQTVSVEPDASTEQAGVTFRPGFHLRQGPPLTAVRVTDLPSSSVMMKPSTVRPTIMAIADPMGFIELVQGTIC